MRLTLDLTQSRVESKYHVAVEDLPSLHDRIPADEREEYDVRTLYFDRPDGSLARTAVDHPRHCTKVRVREYVGDASVWFEVKTRRGRWTRKSRLSLDHAEAARLLGGGDGGPASRPVAADEAEARRYLLEVARGRLMPVGLVTASRQTFIVRNPQLRITLDRGIAYFRPSSELLRLESEPVLEVKHAGTLPAWCEELTSGLRNTTYSKFRNLILSLSDSGKVTDRVDRL
jgi:hypothetical protein